MGEVRGSRGSWDPSCSVEVFSRQQLTELWEHFLKDPYPSYSTLAALASRLGLEEHQVQMWFLERQPASLRWAPYRARRARWASRTPDLGYMGLRSSWRGLPRPRTDDGRPRPKITQPFSIRISGCGKHGCTHGWDLGAGPEDRGSGGVGSWYPLSKCTCSFPASTLESVPAAAAARPQPRCPHAFPLLGKETSDTLEALKRLSVSAPKEGDLGDRDKPGPGDS